MALSALRSLVTRRRKLIPLALAAFAAQVATIGHGDEETSEDSPAEAIISCLDELGLVALDVQPSPIAGLFEVEAKGGVFVYVQGADCRHLIAGDLYERRGDQLVGLTQAKRSAKQRERLSKAMATVSVDDMIVFGPKSETRAVVSVFTDTDCGYCRKLHALMDDYHALGIEVRYLAFPRAGVNSLTYDKMVSAWCAKDPKAALTALKRGDRIPSKTCVNPVSEQYAIGQEVGITGTPAIVLENGTVLPGFLEADALAAQIGL